MIKFLKSLLEPLIKSYDQFKFSQNWKIENLRAVSQWENGFEDLLLERLLSLSET